MADNPFAGSDLQSGPNEEGGLAPVPLEVMPILERCWALATSRLGVVLAALLIPAVPGVLGGIGGAVLQFMEEANRGSDEATIYMAARLAINVVNGIVGVFFSVGQARIFTRVVRGLDADVGMLFSEIGLFPSALALTFLLGLGVGVGLLLCVLPGLVLAIGLQFGVLALVDQDLGPVDALQESWRIAGGRLFEIFLVNLAIVVLMLVVSCVTLGVGYLLMVPVIALAQAVMYHTLLHEAGPRGSAS